MAVWLIYTLSFLYTRYKSYPHTTAQTANILKTLPAPAISICLRDPIQRSRLRQLPHGDVIEDVLLRRRFDFENETLRAILSSFTLQDVMDAGSFRAEEIILEASMRYGRLDPKLNFSTWDDYYSNNGFPVRCFTFNSATTDRYSLSHHRQYYLECHQQVCSSASPTDLFFNVMPCNATDRYFL